MHKTPGVSENKKSKLGYATVILSLGIFFIQPFNHSLAQTPLQDSCDEVLLYAENLFFNADFEEAGYALQKCLTSDQLLDFEKAEIHLLLARIYFAEQKETLAAEALGHLFSFSADYKLGSFLPPPFLEFAENIREISNDEEELNKQIMPLPNITEEKKLNNKRWLLIGGSGLFAVTAIAIMSSGSPNVPTPFPPAPSPPGN